MAEILALTTAPSRMIHRYILQEVRQKTAHHLHLQPLQEQCLLLRQSHLGECLWMLQEALLHQFLLQKSSLLRKTMSTIHIATLLLNMAFLLFLHQVDHERYRPLSNRVPLKMTRMTCTMPPQYKLTRNRHHLHLKLLRLHLLQAMLHPHRRPHRGVSVDPLISRETIPAGGLWMSAVLHPLTRDTLQWMSISDGEAYGGHNQILLHLCSRTGKISFMRSRNPAQRSGVGKQQ